jgi:diguanylate cyclase (GGDEF)-like protein
MESDGRTEGEVISLSDADATTCVLDPAMGLALIRDVIARSMARNQRQPKSAALLAISIDNMRPITELFGQMVVEPLFISLTGHLRGSLRGSDVIARLAEDQLAVVLPYFRFNGAAIAVKRVLAIRSKPVTTHYGAVDLKISVAAVSFPDDNLTPSDVITRAQATLAYNQTRKNDPLALTDTVRERLKSLRKAS